MPLFPYNIAICSYNGLFSWKKRIRDQKINVISNYTAKDVLLLGNNLGLKQYVIKEELQESKKGREVGTKENTDKDSTQCYLSMRYECQMSVS